MGERSPVVVCTLGRLPRSLLQFFSTLWLTVTEECLTFGEALPLPTGGRSTTGCNLRGRSFRGSDILVVKFCMFFSSKKFEGFFRGLGQKRVPLCFYILLLPREPRDTLTQRDFPWRCGMFGRQGKGDVI